MKKYLFIILLVGVGFGQVVPDTIYSRVFGDEGDDLARQIILANDNGFILVGRSYVNELGMRGKIIKTNSEGIEEWRRLYNYNNNEVEMNSIYKCSDGDYIITGSEWGEDYVFNLLVIKIDELGNIIWERSYDGQEYSGFGMKIIESSNGGHIISGMTIEDTGARLFVVKINDMGDVSWSYILEEDGNYPSSIGNSIIEDNQQNFLVVGYNNNCGVLIKFESDGNIVFNNSYCSNWSQRFSDLVLDDYNNIIITGNVRINQSDNSDILLLKLDSNGLEQWQSTFSGEGGNGHSIEQTNDKGFIISGFKDNPADGCVVKFDSTGNFVWTSTYGFGESDSLNDKTYSIIKTNDNGYAIAGYTSNYGNNEMDFWMVRLEPDFLQLAKPFNIADNFLLNQNYPNPFNPITSISYQVQLSGDVTLNIYDVLGNRIKTLIDEPKAIGDYEIKWDGTNQMGERLSSGQYFYQLKVGDFVSTKKMVLLK